MTPDADTRVDRSTEYPAQTMRTGQRLLEFLQWQPSFEELHRTVSEMGNAEKEAALMFVVTSHQQQRKSSNDYAAWWKPSEEKAAA